MSARLAQRKVRALFLSDVHLGMRSARADRLLAFLNAYEAERIYLVGDIVDGWKLRRGWHWSPQYNALAQALLEKSNAGCAITYLAGNHDEFLRQFLGLRFGRIEIADRAVHLTASGRRYLVIHGDQFDTVVANYPRLSRLGHWAYNLALGANTPINRVRRFLGLPAWSLSQWAKRKVKSAGGIVEHFEAALVRTARESGVHGVICGHIHQPDMHDRLGLDYINCGDWLESCTAVVEEQSGTLALVRWPDETATVPTRTNPQTGVPELVH